jgi:hypothetical protein
MKRINDLVVEHAKLHEKHPELDEREAEEENSRERDAAVMNTLNVDAFDDDSALQQKTRDRLRTIEVLGVTPKDSMNISVPDHALAHLPAVVNDYGSRQKISTRRFGML